MECDPDDEMPPPTMFDIFWHFANRYAETSMGLARIFGWQERMETMLLRCEAPNCMKEAVGRSKFLDPRRGHGDELAYTVRHFCSQECQLAICDELERTAQFARLVN